MGGGGGRASNDIPVFRFPLTQLGATFNRMILEDYGDPTGLEHPVLNADM